MWSLILSILRNFHIAYFYRTPTPCPLAHNRLLAKAMHAKSLPCWNFSRRLLIWAFFFLSLYFFWIFFVCLFFVCLMPLFRHQLGSLFAIKGQRIVGLIPQPVWCTVNQQVVLHQWFGANQLVVGCIVDKSMILVMWYSWVPVEVPCIQPQGKAPLIASLNLELHAHSVGQLDAPAHTSAACGRAACSPLCWVSQEMPIARHWLGKSKQSWAGL